MAVTIDESEIQALIDKELGLSSNVEEQPEESITEEMLPQNQDYDEPDWSEHSDFPGVEYREVDGNWLFNVPETSVKLTSVVQYRGFDGSNCPIMVPEVPAVYYPNLDNLNHILRCLKLGTTALLVGDTGSGKTSILEYVAAVTGRPFHRQEFDESTDDQSLFGYVGLENGETVNRLSDYVKAFNYPAIICNDEVCRATTPAQMLLNMPLDRRMVRVPNQDPDVCQVVKAHNEMRMFATDNTVGNGDDLDIYSAANVMDGAVANRFGIVLHTPYPTEGTERKIIAGLAPNMGEDEVKKLAHFSALMHKAFSDRTMTASFSVRNLVEVCKWFEDGVPVADVLEFNFFNRVAKSEQSDVAETIRTIWGN